MVDPVTMATPVMTNEIGVSPLSNTQQTFSAEETNVFWGEYQNASSPSSDSMLMKGAAKLDEKPSPTEILKRRDEILSEYPDIVNNPLARIALETSVMEGIARDQVQKYTGQMLGNFAAGAVQNTLKAGQQ